MLAGWRERSIRLATDAGCFPLCALPVTCNTGDIAQLVAERLALTLTTGDNAASAHSSCRAEPAKARRAIHALQTSRCGFHRQSDDSANCQAGTLLLKYV